MVGGFYLWESMEGVDWYDYASALPSTRGGAGVTKKTNSYSLFGTVTYRPTEALEIVGGLRYTYETNDGASYVKASASGLYPTDQWVPASPHFSGLNPELTVRYKLSDDAMIYGRISNGWRAGGIAPFIDSGVANVYEPEKVWSYEIGGKMEWPDQNFSLNVSAFYNDWKDMQVLLSKPPAQRLILNASSARTYGFEIEGAWQATHELQFSFGYGYTNGRYEKFINPYTGEDYSKNYLPMSPEHSFNAGASYEHEIRNGLNFIAGADYSYKSSYYYLTNNLYPSGDINLVNARIGLSGDNWSATLWSKNLFDERYLSGYFRTGGQDLAAVAEGRSVGLTASWTF